MSRHRTVLPTLALVALAASAVPLRAQRVPGEEPSSPTTGIATKWAPPSFGVRLGFDQRQREEVLGGQVRLPILPSGVIELMGSMDVTYLFNLKEYQYNMEVVYIFDGRAGGIYGGGGLGLRDTIYPDSPTRRNELGYTAVVGFRLPGLGIMVPQLEYRWIFINEAPFAFQTLAIGVNLALWRPVLRN